MCKVSIFLSLPLPAIMQYLKSDYSTVCSVLEPVISAKAKVCECKIDITPCFPQALSWFLYALLSHSTSLFLPPSPLPPSLPPSPSLPSLPPLPPSLPNSLFHSLSLHQDEIAQTLVRILQVGGRIKDFLCNVIMAEVQHVGESPPGS